MAATREGVGGGEVEEDITMARECLLTSKV